MASFTLKGLSEDPVPGAEISTTEDVLRSTGAGARRGLESILATPQDLVNLGMQLIALGGGKTGLMTPEEAAEVSKGYDIPYLPSSEDIHKATTPFFGKSYEPKTTAGKFAGTIAEFAGGSLGNPAGGFVRGVGRHLVEGALSGAASEAAGQATEGSRWEPLARMVAGLGGGASAGALSKGVEHVATSGRRAAEIAAEDAARAGAPGVQLTRGQRTGNINQQMEEQLILRGGRGEAAQRLMQARQDANRQAVGDAATAFADASAPSRGATPVDAGGLLNRQLSNRAEQLRQTGGQQIQSALEQGVKLDPTALRNLPDEISGKLRGLNEFVPDVILDETTPVANQAMNRVERFASQAASDKAQQIDMVGAEQLRRQLGGLEGNTNSDNRALAKIRKYFDDWYDNAIAQHASIAPSAANPTIDPRQVLVELMAGRAQSKAGLDIVQPIGQPPGGRQVAGIGSGKQSAEDTARLFKPNDRGDLSGDAIDAITRLKQVGGTAADFDQVRGIILEQLTSGDPGKVATRVDNFIRNNPTAASALFKPDEIEKLSAWAKTNRSLAPKPGTYNPSAPGIVPQLAKQGGRELVGHGGVIGTILGGPVGTAVGMGLGKGMEWLANRGNVAKTKEVLAPANRDNLVKAMVKGSAKGTGSAAAGSVQGGLHATVDDPGGPNDGKRVTIIGRTPKGGYRGRLEDGTEYFFGEQTLRDIK